MYTIDKSDRSIQYFEHKYIHFYMMYFQNKSHLYNLYVKEVPLVAEQDSWELNLFTQYFRSKSGSLTFDFQFFDPTKLSNTTRELHN